MPYKSSQKSILSRCNYVFRQKHEYLKYKINVNICTTKYIFRACSPNIVNVDIILYMLDQTKKAFTLDQIHRPCFMKQR
jgi:hypothetical protein